MIYIIISLVVGMVYLISGKVQYKKNLYLEGTKARIAGLIFLAPLGLALAVVAAGILFETVGNVSDTRSFEQTLDNLASTLVRNGFIIGFAYINFYSVSRETKERGGCLTYWLIYAVGIALLLIYFLSQPIPSAQLIKSVALGVSILQIITIVGIWFWKKWGIFGFAITTLISLVTSFLITESVLQAFINLVPNLSQLLALYLLVKPKWQFFE